MKRSRCGRSKPGRIREIQHRIAAAAQLDALIPRRQEARSPEAIRQRLPAVARAVLRHHHDKAGQILVLAAQTVRHPRAQARPARELEAGLRERDRGIVIDLLRVHRLDEAEVVHDLRRVRQELADPGARLAVLRELEARRDHRELGLRRRHGGEPLALADGVRKVVAAPLLELRLVVEHLDLRRPARLEEIDDALGLRREVRQSCQPPGLRRVGKERLRTSSSCASAATPMPVLTRPKKWRRVISWA